MGGQGLVVHKGIYQVVTESFRLFVLEVFRESDRPAMATSGHLTRRVLRVPILMILLGGSAFLFLTQQEMTQLYVSLSSTIVMGAIPVVLMSFGGLGGGGK